MQALGMQCCSLRAVNRDKIASCWHHYLKQHLPSNQLQLPFWQALSYLMFSRMEFQDRYWACSIGITVFKLLLKLSVLLPLV